MLCCRTQSIRLVFFWTISYRLEQSKEYDKVLMEAHTFGIGVTSVVSQVRWIIFSVLSVSCDTLMAQMARISSRGSLNP